MYHWYINLNLSLFSSSTLKPLTFYLPFCTAAISPSIVLPQSPTLAFISSLSDGDACNPFKIPTASMALVIWLTSFTATAAFFSRFFAFLK